MNSSESILKLIKTRISEAAEKSDFDAVSKLTKRAMRVQEIVATQEALHAELGEIEVQIRDGNFALVAGSAKTADELVGDNGGPITVEIDFPRMYYGRPVAIISERQASDTMRKVMEVIAEVKSEKDMEILTKLPVNRGPLLSRNPTKDFHNASSGDTYAHQRVGKTPFYVLTHSSTSEKIAALNRVGVVMGFQPECFLIRKTN